MTDEGVIAQTLVMTMAGRVVAVCDIDGPQASAAGITSLARDMGISDDDVAAHWASAIDVLRVYRIDMRAITVHQDVDADSLVIRIAVPRAWTRRLHELNTALAERQLGRGLVPRARFDVGFSV